MNRLALAVIVASLTSAAHVSAQAAPDACGTPPTTTSDVVLGAPTTPGGNLMAAQFSGPLGFFPVEGAAPLPASSSRGLEIAITRAAGATSTETPLALDVRITNRTGSAVRVMRALDGSLEHWRDPSWDLYLRDESSGVVYRWDFHGGRCGNVNPIRPDDVHTIQPGATVDDLPGGWASYVRQATVPVAGRYSVWLAYRYCGQTTGGLPLGRNAATPRVRRGVYVSNAIQIEVR